MLFERGLAQLFATWTSYDVAAEGRRRTASHHDHQRIPPENQPRRRLPSLPGPRRSASNTAPRPPLGLALRALRDLLAGILRALLAERAAFSGQNKESTWLFPGRRAGQSNEAPQPRRSTAPPRNPRPGQARISASSTRAASPSTGRRQVLGLHDKHTTCVLIEAGGNWNRYAPGDNDQ